MGKKATKKKKKTIRMLKFIEVMINKRIVHSPIAIFKFYMYIYVSDLFFFFFG